MNARILISALALALVASSALGAQPTSVIASLIDAAGEGDTVLVPPGVYEGPLRIAKRVVLDGQGGATIDGQGVDVIVDIVAPGTTLRGFTVRNTSTSIDREAAAIRAEAESVVIEHNRIDDALFGIDLRSSPHSIVRHNTVRGKNLDSERRGDAIRLWWSNDSTVENNDVADSRDLVFWYSENLVVARNTVSNSRYGLHFMYSHDTELVGNTLERNSVGIYLMYSKGITLTDNTITNNRGASGYGVGLKDCDSIVLERNALLANRVGVYIDNSPSSIDSTGVIRENLIAFNESGVVATPNTHDNVFSANAFLDNEEQVSVHGRGSLTLNKFSESGVGNFWSDYAGFDADNDGVGDLPYEPRSLFESLLAREPNLRILQHSPAQQTVEFTARMLPEVRPEPKLVDPSPLARAPELGFEGVASAPAPAPMLALGALFLAISSGAAMWLAREDVTLSTRGRNGA
jgi:nitrous oxidase accessory protein